MDLMSKQNPGVEVRNRRDEQQTEAEQDVYAALERKAELYDKLGKSLRSPVPSSFCP